MGCRQKEQRPEENDLYIFFYKMMKETEFEYSIKNYEKNYEQISISSKNKFKKLEKKQSVRIGFVNEIMRYLSKINLDEKEDHNTKKLLFFILILTLTLKNFLKENKNNYNIRSNNDLQQSLLTMAVEALNHKFQKNGNLKLVIYYLAKMLVLLFKEMNDINQYINIEKYIENLNIITNDSNIFPEKDKEKYSFLKLNLACLGEFFIHNYKNSVIKMKYINIIMDYFMYVFWINSSFIGRNYNIYKKEIFSENYLFNINEIIIEREKENDTNSTLSSVNRKKSLLSIKLVDSIINSKKKSESNNEEEFSISTEKLIKMRRNQNYIDLNQINDNFYFFFKSIIYDISRGKNIFETYFDHIDKFVENEKGNNNYKKEEISDFHKTNEILLLLLFVKCKINFDNVIIYSFIEFEGEYMKYSLDKKEFIYEFVIIFFDLFRDEKDIYDRNLKLLSQIFLIEIEKLDEEENFLIERILNKPNQLELFISFLSKLIKILKEDYDPEIITYSLEKICDIMKAQILKGINASKKNKHKKYILNKEQFEIIFKFCNLKKQKAKAIEDRELFNIQLKLLQNILSLINTYFSLDEVYSDITCRNLLYNKIISSIAKLSILIIDENDNNYTNSLIDLVKQLINVIKKNTTNFFVDFKIIYKYLKQNLYKISKIEKNEINIIYFKLIYSISIFIIMQLKIIYCIPSSILNIHKDIIQAIINYNYKYKSYFQDINIEAYQNNTSKNIDDINDNFFKKIIKDFSKNKENEYGKIILTNKDFKYLINIIHNKLYGKNSPLIIYYKSQESKKTKNFKEEIIEKDEDLNMDDFDELIISEEKNENDSLIISINGSNSNFMDMSIRGKNGFSEAGDGSEEYSYFNDNSSQNIHMPKKYDDDEEEIVTKINLINDKNDLDYNLREEKSIHNFKI